MFKMAFINKNIVVILLFPAQNCITFNLKSSKLKRPWQLKCRQTDKNNSALPIKFIVNVSLCFRCYGSQIPLTLHFRYEKIHNIL
jgi:hypothetical protein